MANTTYCDPNIQKNISNNPILKHIMSVFYYDVIDLAKLTNPHSILDIGCGEGYATIRYAQCFPTTPILAMDIDLERIHYAIKHNHQENIRYVDGDLFRCPHDLQRFDLVICNEVLEHVTDAKDALNILVSHSQKNVLITVPNEPWFQLANFIRGKYWATLGNVPGHIHHWSRTALEELLTPYGTIQELRTSTFWNIALIKISDINN